MDYLEGIANSVLVEFLNKKDFEIPDVGSVYYTLYDTSGVAIAGHTNVAVTTTATTTRFVLALLAAIFSIAVGKRFEKRTLVVRYTVSLKPRTIRQSFRIIPYLNHSVSADSIRAYIGINPHELPDQDIDIFNAYLKIEATATKTVLDAKLATGTTEELSANNAILYQSVLDVIPSLRLRIAQKETNGSVGFDRLAKLDLDKLEADTRNALADVLSTATGRQVESPVLGVFTLPVDPVTGV
jgi:hypothetical protein